MSEVVRIGSIMIFHLNNLWKVLFFILCQCNISDEAADETTPTVSQNKLTVSQAVRLVAEEHLFSEEKGSIVPVVLMVWCELMVILITEGNARTCPKGCPAWRFHSEFTL